MFLQQRFRDQQHREHQGSALPVICRDPPVISSPKYQKCVALSVPLCPCHNGLIRWSSHNDWNAKDSYVPKLMITVSFIKFNYQCRMSSRAVVQRNKFFVEEEHEHYTKSQIKLQLHKEHTVIDMLVFHTVAIVVNQAYVYSSNQQHSTSVAELSTNNTRCPFC